MLEKTSHILKKPFVLAILGIILLILLGGAGYEVWTVQQPPQQPIQFPHYKHIGMGIQCLYCHPGALTGASAGLPTQSKCWGCHQQIKNPSPELTKLANYVQKNKPIPWVPVAIQPDFVFFDHRPHIAAGVSCETCHGELSKMTTAQPQFGQNMGWCLSCHQKRAAGNLDFLTKLNDCATCHR